MHSITNKFTKKKKTGYVIWITGLPGSGKTSIAKRLKKHETADYSDLFAILHEVLKITIKLMDKLKVQLK